MTEADNGMEERGGFGRATSNRLEQVVEALVFAADEPLTARRMAEIFGEVTGQERPSEEDIEHAVECLNDRYDEEDRPLRIEAWAGGFRMATIAAVAPYIKELFQSQRERRLSRSLLESLAILAYRQPVTKPEVEFVRGVDCDYAIRRLLELGIIDTVGRSESVGRPLLYGTTPRFLELFGLNGLEDLPNLREIETMLDDPAFQKERALLLMKNGLSELRPMASDGLDGPVRVPADPSLDEDSAGHPGNAHGSQPDIETRSQEGTEPTT